MRQLGRNPETGEPCVAIAVDQHICRLDVLMYEAVPMNLAESFRQAYGDGQDATQIERLPLIPLKNQIQRLTARVSEYEYCPPFVTSGRQRPGCPCWIASGCERVFVLEPPEVLRRRLFCSGCHCQDRRWVAVLPPAIKVKSAPSRRTPSRYPEGSVMEGILVATVKPQNAYRDSSWVF